MPPLSDNDLQAITASILETMLDLPCQVRDDDGLDILAHVGQIGIHGGWDGLVELQVCSPLAQHAAEKLFGIDATSLTPADLDDVVGELTNMIGGLVKAQLPGPSSLTLPTIVSAPAVTDRRAELQRLSAVAGDALLRIRILAAGAAAFDAWLLETT